MVIIRVQFVTVDNMGLVGKADEISNPHPSSERTDF